MAQLAHPVHSPPSPRGFPPVCQDTKIATFRFSFRELAGIIAILFVVTRWSAGLAAIMGPMPLAERAGVMVISFFSVVCFAWVIAKVCLGRFIQ